MEDNVVNLFYKAAEKYPNKAAIVHRGSQVAYHELANDVRKTVTWLKNKGIKSGDTILVFVPMSIDLYRIVLAIFHLGATAVFLDEWVNKKRLKLACQIADCNVFIGSPKAKFLTLFFKPLRKIPIRLSSRKQQLAPFKASSELPCIDAPLAPALITFTTGSTGIPKAAIRTHSLLYHQFLALRKELSITGDTIGMPALPIVLLLNLGEGATSIVPTFNPKKLNKLRPQKIVKELFQYKVDSIVASPFFVATVAKYIIDNRLETKDVHFVATGGAPVFSNEARMYEQAFPNANCTIVYGSTEAEPISTVSSTELIQEKKETGLLVGNVADVTQLKIIPWKNEPIEFNTIEDLEKSVCKEGEIGEVVVEGKHVVRLYLNNEPAQKRNKLMIGSSCWHRTGDSGYLKNGSLYLTGRCETLIYKGKKLVAAPFVYERIMSEFKEVKSGTVLELDNKLTVIVELEKGVVKSFFINKLKSKSIAFDSCVVLPSIPRDPRHHSKIDYERLKTLLKV